MGKIQQFRFNPSDNVIRVEMVKNEPWFVAKDVCDALTLTDTEVALRKLDNDEKLMRTLYASGQNRSMWTINESGLYSLVFQSRKPEAKSFRKWVTGEVLPAIRKTGKYEVSGVKKSATRMRRAELVNMEMLELLWLIRDHLVQGDVKRTALELGVSQQTAIRVLNGEVRNAHVLRAFYEVAKKNRTDGTLEFYSNPKKMRNRLMGISDGGQNKAYRQFNSGELPEGYERGRGGQPGNQNARKYHY